MPPKAGLISRLLRQPVEIVLRGRRPAAGPSPWVQQQQPGLMSPKAAFAILFSSQMPRTSRSSFLLNSTKPYNPRQQTFPERFYSTKPEPDSPSLSQRLISLSREYGWSALGVYLALTVLDFPFCFAAVRLLGVERIGHLEHVVLNGVKDVLRSIWLTRSIRDNPSRVEVKHGATTQADHYRVREAQNIESEEGASILTQLGLAWVIHKSLIFIRVPLTAAVTPKAVKTLRGWGWNIGRRPPKST